jgi:S-DNA-T family DNA segregation ATPase FtsK/SpoIIIE
MIMPWCERQREAVRAFRQAIVSRAGRELEIADGAQARQHGTEQHYAAEKERVEGEYAGAQADAVTRAEKSRRQLQERHKRECDNLQREKQKGKDKHLQEYAEAKAKLETEFRDSRWTTNAVFEADKRVAKEQMLEASTSCKTLLRKLLGDWRSGRKLIEPLEFLDDIPPLNPKEININEGDPWLRMQQCADQARSDLHGLQTMRSPHFINGRFPWLVLAALWLILSAPGFLFPPFWYIWLAVTASVLPLGYWLVTSLRRKTNDRIIAYWLSLRYSAHLARLLRPVCLRLAKKTYLTKKRQSYKRNRQLLRSIVESTGVKLHDLRAERDTAVKRNERDFKKRFIEQQEQQKKEMLAVEQIFERDQREAKERHDVEARLVEADHVRRREENHQWHTQEWTALLRDWKSACDQFLQACRGVARDAEHWFPPLSGPLALPKTLPHGLPIGAMRWTLEMFPDGVPQDVQLPRPDLSKFACPALLAFPQRASLLYRANDGGRPVAIDALQALLLRCWTAMPAGKVRCTIIDPVGRGENFSAFMHLADHDEKLVDGRIWTETAQIDERLNNLTLHMENVLQKYLRNQFETLAEYNVQAGEVAEPFHFLVVAHFPVNFSEDAARRLVSLASAGARCGIYTFVVVDTKQPAPHGFNIADLENVCTILDWRKDHFVWEDDDFGMFPLALEQSPPPARCTELLQQVGEEAVRSSKVEVPFEWIMPPRDSWWSSDSASGIRVPIGRFGATGKQYLELGQGTSQHVLVAGKTGSGKSTLLHVLISQLAMFYSPSEVELYLVDFKKGVEFKAYASLSLPHARVIAVESEREFGLSVLQRLDAELSNRGEIYRAAGVNDLAAYREYAEKHPELPYLPRIMLIVDEFQEFFIEDDKLAQESSLFLDRLVRQGRAFGVHVLLGSQTIGGAYSLARSTIDQMAVRIALQCSEADAHLILSRDNTEARLLSRPGEGIYNAMHGLLEGNHLFQVVWLNDSKRDDLLRQLRELSRQREDFLTPIVFEGAVPADLTTNHLLKNLWHDPAKPTATWSAWLGDAVAIKDPTCATFRKQSGSNFMILGQQEEIAVALTVSSLVSLSAGVDPAPAERSIHLVIGQALDAASEELVKQLAEVLPIRLWLPRDIGALLNQLADEIERRGTPGDSRLWALPQFLFVYGVQRLRDLRRPDDDFGFSRKGDDKTPFRQFTQVLKEGPPVGVFTLLWCDTLVNLQRSLDRQTLREFDQRVLMQMSAADSSSLMDNPAAAKLGAQRALFYTEDLGKIEKFRPYALPSAKWIKELQGSKPELTPVNEASGLPG